LAPLEPFSDDGPRLTDWLPGDAKASPANDEISTAMLDTTTSGSHLLDTGETPAVDKSSSPMNIGAMFLFGIAVEALAMRQGGVQGSPDAAPPPRSFFIASMAGLLLFPPSAMAQSSSRFAPPPCSLLPAPCSLLVPPSPSFSPLSIDHDW
jgi:hypothetical protein